MHQEQILIAFLEELCGVTAAGFESPFIEGGIL